jgi:hypothetical protein
MFDSLTSDQQFNLLVIATVVVLPFLILGAVGLILSIRDRAYERGFQEAYDWAIRVQSEGRIIA